MDESRCYVSSIPGAAGLLAVMAWAMSARLLGPLMERETCTGTLRGLSEEGPAAGAGPDPGRGNPEGLEPMPARAYMQFGYNFDFQLTTFCRFELVVSFLLK